MYGGPVPWAEWMPALSWNILRLIVYYLSFAFLASLFRRQWVDIEALPFPYATGAAKLIDMAYEKEDRSTTLFGNKWLWLGLLLGFIAMFPYWGWVIPGLGFTKLDYAYSLGIDLTPLVLIPLAPLNFNFDAFLIGASFLVPVKTLLSYIIVTIIIHWIWWPLMAYTGIWEAQPAGTAGAGHGLSCIVWRGGPGIGPRQLAWSETYGAIQWLAFGAMFGLIFYPILVTFRGELANGIKALFGKAPPEVEEREPMRYAYLLGGYLILTTIYILTWWYSSEGYLPILFAYLYLIPWGLFWMGRARRYC